jgi:hypothetical protein
MKAAAWRAPRCASGKAAFRSRGVALRALERIAVDNAQAVAPGEGAPRRAYRCDCGAWHLTKQGD